MAQSPKLYTLICRAYFCLQKVIYEVMSHLIHQGEAFFSMKGVPGRVFSNIHEATRWSLCPESSRFRVHGSGFCVHGSGFTVEGSRFLSLFTVHVSQFWVHGSRFPIHSSQSTVHSSQFTVHSSQFTVYRLRDTKKWIISTVLCRKIALIHLVMRSLHMKK